jgi:hypothetical protein
LTPPRSSAVAGAAPTANSGLWDVVALIVISALLRKV